MSEHEECEALAALHEASSRKKTIILVDVDDVVLHHRFYLKKFLQSKGLSITRTPSMMDWQIINDQTSEILNNSATESILAESSLHFARIQEPIEGAINSLKILEIDNEILFLSNISAGAAADRRRRLDELGLSYPLLRNVGGKGRTVSRIQSIACSPIFFIDDSLRQIVNVRKHSPLSVCLHALLIEDPLSSDIDSHNDAHVFYSWSEMEKFFRTLVY